MRTSSPYRPEVLCMRLPFVLFWPAFAARLARMRSTFALLLAAGVSVTAQQTLTIEAGDFDRHDAIVECRLSTGVSGFLNGPVVQHDAEGRAWFIEPELKRGEKKSYQFVKANGLSVAQAKSAPGSVILSVFGKTALVYRTEETDLPPNRPDLKPIFQRGGYIHPVLSPSGKQITDDYPANHKHHHGIWFAWTHTMRRARPNLSQSTKPGAAPSMPGSSASFGRWTRRKRERSRRPRCSKPGT